MILLPGLPRRGVGGFTSGGLGQSGLAKVGIQRSGRVCRDLALCAVPRAGAHACKLGSDGQPPTGREEPPEGFPRRARCRPKGAQPDSGLCESVAHLSVCP